MKERIDDTITESAGDNKPVEKQIKILCVNLDITLAELAKKCGSSPQAFSQKMKRNTFTPADLKAIAQAVNCQYTTAFILPNGERVEY